MEFVLLAPQMHKWFQFCIDKLLFQFIRMTFCTFEYNEIQNHSIHSQSNNILLIILSFVHLMLSRASFLSIVLRIVRSEA